jgi:hypothetical protein
MKRNVYLLISRATICAVLLIFAAAARAAEPFRPRSHADFEAGQLIEETGLALVGAEVAWANYELLRADFPPIAHYTNGEIDAWLVRNFAYIGSRQKLLDSIRQTPVPVDSSQGKTIYRPPGWIRSGVMEALDDHGNVIGMVDVKGLGHGERRNPSHSQWTIEKQIEAFHSAPPAEIERLRALP